MATQSPQTEEISKTIAQLRFETIRETLKSAKCKSIGTKPVLVKNYEAAVLDVGIEKFVSRLPEDVIDSTVKLLSLESASTQSTKDTLTENVQSVGLGVVLGKADEDLLKKFSAALGLDDETTDYAKKIEDEVMLIGMEAFLQNLNPEILKKHCAELNLTKSGAKSELVERLMVHIFELEPLEDKEVAPVQDKSANKEKEEAKPKENKKRKGPEPKEKKEPKKSKKADEKADTAATQRPKRSAATKKKVEDEIEEKPAKKQKKEPTQKETLPTKKEKKEKEPAKTRTPHIAPPLSTIVKGQYDATELHNKFNLTDLQKYAKQEGLKSVGQKKVIIKRIVAYLETGKKEEEKKRGKPKAKATKKKSGSKKNAKENKDKVQPTSDTKATEEKSA